MDTQIEDIDRTLRGVAGERAEARSPGAGECDARGVTKSYKYFVGHMIVRHMCADGLRRSRALPSAA